MPDVRKEIVRVGRLGSSQPKFPRTARMDDLFQGLLSTGRGHAKTSSLIEAEDTGDHSPFGAVFSLAEPAEGSPTVGEPVPTPTALSGEQQGAEAPEPELPRIAPGPSGTPTPDGTEPQKPTGEARTPQALPSIAALSFTIPPDASSNGTTSNVLRANWSDPVPAQTSSPSIASPRSIAARAPAAVVPIIAGLQAEQSTKDNPLDATKRNGLGPRLATTTVPVPGSILPSQMPGIAEPTQLALDSENASQQQGRFPSFATLGSVRPAAATTLPVALPAETTQALAASTPVIGDRTNLSGNSPAPPKVETRYSGVPHSPISQPAGTNIVPTTPIGPLQVVKPEVMPQPQEGTAGSTRPDTASGTGAPEPAGVRIEAVTAQLKVVAQPDSTATSPKPQSPQLITPEMPELSPRSTSADTPSVLAPPIATAQTIVPTSYNALSAQPHTQTSSGTAPTSEMGIEHFVTLQTNHAPQAINPSPSAPIVTPSANLPTLAAQQIAAALQDRALEPGQPIELALDPPELGRVRIHMNEVAGVLTLTIQAERPETAELMRRHLDLLAQEFADAGIDAPSVHISQDGGGSETDDRGTPTPSAYTTEEDASTSTPSTNARNHSGALDLRL